MVGIGVVGLINVLKNKANVLITAHRKSVMMEKRHIVRCPDTEPSALTYGMALHGHSYLLLVNV